MKRLLLALLAVMALAVSTAGQEDKSASAVPINYSILSYIQIVNPMPYSKVMLVVDGAVRYYEPAGMFYTYTMEFNGQYLLIAEVDRWTTAVVLMDRDGQGIIGAKLVVRGFFYGPRYFSPEGCDYFGPPYLPPEDGLGDISGGLSDSPLGQEGDNSSEIVPDYDDSPPGDGVVDSGYLPDEERLPTD